MSKTSAQPANHISYVQSLRTGSSADSKGTPLRYREERFATAVVNRADYDTLRLKANAMRDVLGELLRAWPNGPARAATPVECERMRQIYEAAVEACESYHQARDRSL